MQKAKKQSQDSVVLQYLQKGKTISTAEAFKLFGIVDLQSVIRNIRKTTDVQGKWIKCKNQYGEPTRYKQYFLGGA
jgi:hypothetical protein